MLNWLGLILAGLLNGSFAVPMKTARVWQFHHIWMVHSFLAMAFIPWAVVFLAVPDWSGVVTAVPFVSWLGLVAWGAMFGIGSLMYGVAVDILGIALGFSIQLGLSIVLGALLPQVWFGTLSLHTRKDALFLGGLSVMVVGVVLCGYAGGSKSHDWSISGERFRKGLAIALVGGLLAPTLNFGIRYGTSLLAGFRGTPSPSRFPVETYLAWAVFLSAAAAVQAGYCFLRILRAKKASLLWSGGSARDALQVLAMSLTWIASIFVYGRSSFGLGRLGFSVAWPVFIALIILTSNAWGVVLGEWKSASPKASRLMLGGSSVLALAAFMIGQGNRG